MSNHVLSPYGASISVLVNGRPVRVYLHEGRHYIESREGTEYSLEIKSQVISDTEVVASVDGLSVMSGEPASTADRGYILSGFTTLTIPGFRLSATEVGAFKFTSKDKAYAAEKGENAAQNTGVIAVALFGGNKPCAIPLSYTPNAIPCGITPTPIWIGGHTTTTSGSPNSETYYYYSSSICEPTMATAYSCNASTGILRGTGFSSDHGTTWGNKLSDPTVSTQFTRAGYSAVTEIYYASRERLIEMGVKLVNEKSVAWPSAFPADTGYAKPPANWTGK